MRMRRMRDKRLPSPSRGEDSSPVMDKRRIGRKLALLVYKKGLKWTPRRIELDVWAIMDVNTAWSCPSKSYSLSVWVLFLKELFASNGDIEARTSTFRAAFGNGSVSLEAIR
ncbi:unnamed protein product [Cyprideis torosa]|uniref:Uncharacterized protein n=1 Tax=Cyprideis torosa TaxID=163714 RepID=A0A7R8ZWE9_9CRUS|nr:unnamed protein product [Cyprideis torosa]CAG0904793.1 unnamed protein product [Cyprideis torosa]